MKTLCDKSNREFHHEKMIQHQILLILKEVETGIFVKELCHEHGMGSSNIKRLKEFEAKNCKLKHILAELSLKSQLQEEIIKKALVATQTYKTWIEVLQAATHVLLRLTSALPSVALLRA